MVTFGLSSTGLLNCTGLLAAHSAVTPLRDGIASASLIDQYRAGITLMEGIDDNNDLRRLHVALADHVHRIVAHVEARLPDPEELTLFVEDKTPLLETVLTDSVPLERYQNVSTRLRQAQAQPASPSSSHFTEVSLRQMTQSLLQRTCEPIETIQYKVLGKPEKFDAARFERDAWRFFGRAVPYDLIQAGCQLDIPGYSVTSLGIYLRKYSLDLAGIIDSSTEASIGEFHRFFMSIDADKLPRSAHSNRYALDYADDRRQTKSENHGLGIGRRATQRYLSLLHQLDYPHFSLTAQQVGRWAWPRMGFDFADETTREVMLIRLAEHLRERGIPMTADDEQRLFSIRHAWELTEFTSGDRAVGREFLLDRSPARLAESYDLRFHLDSRFKGWDYLFIPRGWEGLPVTALEASLARYAHSGRLGALFRNPAPPA